MEIKDRKLGIRKNRTTAMGAAGATVAACAACCISLPLLGPMLAWLGITGLGTLATGWHVGMAAAVAAGFAVIFVYRHRRRSMQRSKSCGCNSRC
ncbi:MAG TPA: hypothetical protein VGU61_15585 [Noviherbaspirillum sp.]|jgi:membrane protein implicated in regulation of membrane protease activity|uniref:hypothetical protein n=1 Tax=Noviherbaspirillum sp. TaxID=1926288 RepID=UPI002DDCC618|nr:hypothetical protein [Noviherbaspirillum sp.]HEV2611690.1 hypothetical protein [Noviherbaspirillum sp.]